MTLELRNAEPMSWDADRQCLHLEIEVGNAGQEPFLCDRGCQRQTSKFRETLCESGRWIDALKKRGRLLKKRGRILKKRGRFLRRGV